MFDYLFFELIKKFKEGKILLNFKDFQEMSLSSKNYLLIL